MENLPNPIGNPLTDIEGLRTSGLFIQGHEPSIRTLREWTKLRRIPYIKLGHFIYYDLADVAAHIRSKLRVSPDAHATVVPTRARTGAVADEPIAFRRWSRPGQSGFKIQDFHNRNGTVSHRVSGWLRGVRIRRNFKLKADAQEELRALELQELATANEFRTVVTRLNEAQVREAEAVFERLKGKSHNVWSYIDYAVAHWRPPESDKSLDDAVADYVATRTKDRERTLISACQGRRIKHEMETFLRWFPDALMPQFTPETLNAFLERGSVSLKTFNNRRGILSTFFKFARRKGWIDGNPIEKIPQFRLAHRRGSATTITADHAADLMSFLEGFEHGSLVPYFALCLFAGVRPCFRFGEMSRLTPAAINLDTGVVHIEPEVSKVRMKRLITIQPNLAAWLRAYPVSRYPLVPSGMARLHREVFRRFALTHDVLRHTFISMYVGKFRSIADAALQAGNSEEIIRRHYLDLKSQAEAARFFAILPHGHRIDSADVDEIAIASPS